MFGICKNFRENDFTKKLKIFVKQMFISFSVDERTWKRIGI